MEWINHNHLRAFWATAREGSVAGACRLLHVSQPTVSGQVRALERALGCQLFQRRGRGLVLTDRGRAAFRHADEIASLSAELMDSMRHPSAPERLRLRVGVADVLPKLVVYRMLQPVLSLPEAVRLSCYEGRQAELVSRLTSHDLDVVLADSPLPPHTAGGAYGHRLGESALMVFGTEALARRFRPGFPGSLEGAPLLLPTVNTVVRRSLDHWFVSKGLHPQIIGEFEDSALLKVFGQSGAGLFVAPALIEREVRAQYGVRVVGRLDGIHEQFYALSMERTIRHPAVTVLTDVARAGLAAVAPRRGRAGSRRRAG